jgi:hypothetical protein
MAARWPFLENGTHRSLLPPSGGPPQPKASNRAIGRMMGVDEKTVRNDAAENSAPSKNTSETSASRAVAAENSAPPPSLSGEQLSFAQVADQRKRIATKIKALQPKASSRAIGRMMGNGAHDLKSGRWNKCSTRYEKHQQPQRRSERHWNKCSTAAGRGTELRAGRRAGSEGGK